MMYATWKLLVACGSLCVVVATVGYMRREAIHENQWVAVDLPIRERDTSIRSDFRIGRGGDYELAIALSRPPPGPDRLKAECLLGVRSREMDLCEDEPVVDVAWRIRERDGRVVLQDTSAGSVPGGAVTVDRVLRVLNSFTARDQTEYSLTIEVREAFGDLIRYNPRVIIEATGSENVDTLVEDFLLSVLTYGFGAVGLGLLAAGLFRVSRQRVMPL